MSKRRLGGLLATVTLLSVAAPVQARLAALRDAPRVRSTAVSPTVENPIVRENRRRGSVGWRSAKLDASIIKQRDTLDDGDHHRVKGAAFPIGTQSLPFGRFIAGYVSKDSIDQGESIELHVSTYKPTYDVQIFRMGWYGGARSRLVWSRTGLTGVYSTAPAPNAFGTVAANWPVSLAVATDSSWTSGIYIAKLITAGDVEYATWVIRNDRSTSPVLVQVATTTYQAYETWGGASLYQPATPAVKVSYDRPYYGGDGTGLLFSGDAQMSAFLEREGYDVSYSTSTDTQSRPNLMDNHRLFLVAFHDEYWSKQMRDNLDAWIANGKNVAFLSANNMYWQIRFEPGPSGQPNRVVVCYKSTADPVFGSTPSLATLWWRNPAVNRPESAVTGNWYDDTRQTFGSSNWIVSKASHWFYAGTGLANGSALPGVVGVEWDLIPSVTPPANVAELSNSPMAPIGTRQQATLRTAPSGAQVFDAGTLRYPLFLDNYTTDPATSAVVQQMTRNLVTRLSGGTVTPPTTTIAPTTTTSTTALTTTTAPTTTAAPTTIPATTVPPETSSLAPRPAAPSVGPVSTLPRGPANPSVSAGTTISRSPASPSP